MIIIEAYLYWLFYVAVAILWNIGMALWLLVLLDIVTQGIRGGQVLGRRSRIYDRYKNPFEYYSLMAVHTGCLVMLLCFTIPSIKKIFEFISNRSFYLEEYRQLKPYLTSWIGPHKP